MSVCLPPRCASRFTPGEPIASGGCGVVYRAVDRTFDRPVALKVLHASAFQTPHSVERFTAEARITASLKHPHVLVVIDHDVEDGVPWIAYELIEGPTLRQLIKRGPLRWPRALALTAQVATALEAAHAQDVLHRDVKPENVFEAQPGHAKIGDFGIARWARDAFQTEVGVLVGTPAYVAPELTRGHRATVATDLYALGVMLYEMLTAQRPFNGPTIATILEAQRHQPTPLVRYTRGDVPEPVDELIGRLLSKDPAQRPADARTVSAEIGQILRGLIDASGSGAEWHPPSGGLLSPSAEPPPAAATTATVDHAAATAPPTLRPASRPALRARPGSDAPAPPPSRGRPPRRGSRTGPALALVTGFVATLFLGLTLPGRAPVPASPAAPAVDDVEPLLERQRLERRAWDPEHDAIWGHMLSGERARQEQAQRLAQQEIGRARGHLDELTDRLDALPPAHAEDGLMRRVVRAHLTAWAAYYRIRVDRLKHRLRISSRAIADKLDSPLALGKLAELEAGVSYDPAIAPDVLAGLRAVSAAGAALAHAPRDAPPFAGLLFAHPITLGDQFTAYRFTGEAHSVFLRGAARWAEEAVAADPPTGFHPGGLLADCWEVALAGDAARRRVPYERALESFAAARRAMPQCAAGLDEAEAMLRKRRSAAAKR